MRRWNLIALVSSLVLCAAAKGAERIGIVVPRDLSASRSASGSVTTDLHACDGIPALRVWPLDVPLPLDSSGRPELARLLIDAGGGPQSASGRITIRVPYDAMNISIRIIDASTHEELAQKSVPLPRLHVWQSAKSTGSPADFSAQPVLLLGALQAIWGPFGGDSDRTRVSVDGLPAPIVAETRRAVYWRLPDGIASGRHRLTVVDGEQQAAFDVVVMSLEIAQQPTRYHVRLRLGNVPVSAWQEASIPADLVNLYSLEKTPEFRSPQSGQRGEIMLVLTTPDGVRVFHIGPDALRDGVFTYDGVIQSARGGTTTITGLAIAALAPLLGEVPNETDRR
jgi:hypothetical protein